MRELHGIKKKRLIAGRKEGRVIERKSADTKRKISKTVESPTME